MDILESETIDLDPPSASLAPMLPTCCTGDTLSDRYRLDEEIGRGGMGIVYRAWDVELERPVAIKVMAAHIGADDARERLFSEARAAAALSHPHVVAVHDVGEHDGMPYFVMELIDGPSLKQRELGALSEIVDVARQICDALGHAHDHGLVHRDLKPGNVLVEDRSGKLSVKIVDLGLAVRGHGVRISHEGGISGTVSYMAPEQALGRGVDGRTDLYALGVILYELVTGRLPFAGDNALAVLSQHLHAPVVPPRTYREDLPDSLDQAIVKLLEKDPDDRFATAAEAAAALVLAPDDATAVPAATPTPLGGLVRGRLVGREAELDTLRRSWNQALAGRGGMVLVSGEPGSGKTRLVRELADYARITGGTVLSGGCYELEAATPYLPFVEALRSWVHESSDDELRAAVGDSGSELSRLAPELSTRVGPFPAGPSLTAAEERLRLFDGIARFLFDWASGGGMLLFIDDLQWADQASLSLLHYLVRLIGKQRVLVVGCYRETELDRAHPLAEALDDWNRERAAVRVHLRRLSAEGTHAMLAVLLGDECLSDEFCASIHRETEGNPFFIEEVVKTLVDEGQIVCECGRWRRRGGGEGLVLPQGVKAAIGRRLDHVGAPTTDVLRTAAILGKTFDFSELAAVADKDEDELLDALDEAVAAQLLETRSGETVAFTHDKIREVLYHELNPIRRRRLHTRIAEGLEALRTHGGRVAVEDLAHHSIEGGALEKGFDYAMEAAADATSVFAYTDALRLYERARECAVDLGRESELPAIDAAMGEVYGLKGEPLASAEHYERALAATADPVEQVRLRCLIGEAYVNIGDARALTYLDDAKTALDPDRQPAEVARAAMIEARFHHYHGRSREAAERLHLAVAPAERSGDTPLMGFVYGYLAGAYQHLAEFEESDRWAQRCIDIGGQRDVPSVTSIGYEFLVENSFMRGQWRQALDYVPQHRAVAVEASSTDRLAWSYLGPTIANLGLGNIAEAEAAAKEGIDLATRIGDERLAVFLGSWSAQVAAELGHLDEAAELAEAWFLRADGLGLKSGLSEALRIQAYVAQRSDDHAGVLEFASRADAVLDGTDEKVYPAWFGGMIGESLVALDRLDEAEEGIQNNLEATSRAGMPHWHGLTLRARAGLHRARGDDEAARTDYNAAVASFEDLGSRIELGRTLALRAPLSAKPEDDLDRARALFEACGAAGDVARLAPSTPSGGAIKGGP